MSDCFGDIVAVRGGGDLATGVIQKFHRAGMRVVVFEVAAPTAIRRSVALCEAVYDGTSRVEDMIARRVISVGECGGVWERGEIPLLVDPDAAALPALRPDGVVDAILAKRNLGTHSEMADIVIALGPGFAAPADAHAVIETMRGHELGRVIFSGTARPNTGLPGEIGGKSAERVVRAPCEGSVLHYRKIGDAVAKGERILSVAGADVSAPFDGLLRGLIRDGLAVGRGTKIADVDLRLDSDWNSISDKARCIGGGALEAFLYLRNRGRQCHA